MEIVAQATALGTIALAEMESQSKLEPPHFMAQSKANILDTPNSAMTATSTARTPATAPPTANGRPTADTPPHPLAEMG